MSGPAIKAPRSDLFNVRPDSETVVIRMITDPNHPEFDERALDPIDENLISDILARGQHTPATGYKSGKDEEGRDIVTLMFGRQRWKAVSEIWNRFRNDGLDLSLAPSFRIYIQVPKNDAVKRELRISENRHRKPLEGLALAREVQEYLNIVGDSDESREHARVLFNFVSLDAMKHNLALLDTTPAVQEQLAAGTLSPTGALQLSRQPAEVQDAVAGKIAAAAGTEDQDEDQGDDDHEGEEEQESHATEAPKDSAPTEKPAKTRPVSVSEVKEMIRDTTGQASYAMVSLKQVEKEIDKKERQLEAALSKLEECEGPHDKKMPDRAAKVSEIRGYIDALRWARGETSVATAEGPTNDKASAAWDALRDALTSAAWPKILRPAHFPAIPSPWGSDVTPEQRAERNRMRAERDDAIRDSKVLVVAGERVAFREGDGVSVDMIRVDTSTKWFQRLMDPYGIPSALVRDFGAHGWLVGKTDLGSLSTWKISFAPLSKGRTVIGISEAQVVKWAASVPEFGLMHTAEDLVLCIVAENVSRVTTEIRRDNRFGAPWFGADMNDEAIGPDFAEDRGMREQIRDDLDAALGLHRNRTNIGDDECTWATVGELIDYVENRLKLAAPENAPVAEPIGEAPTEAGDLEDGDEEEMDGDA